MNNQAINQHDQIIEQAGRQLAPNFGEFLMTQDVFMEKLMDAAAAYVEAQGIYSDEAVIDVASELVMRVTVLVD